MITTRATPASPWWQVFTHSSNIGAGKLGLMAGAERMQTYFRNFGIFNAAPSALLESARPIVPHRFDEDTVAHMAFGQGISISRYRSRPPIPPS